MIASLPNVIVPASPEPPVPANKPVDNSPVHRTDTDVNAPSAAERAQDSPEQINTNASEQKTSSESSTEPKAENFQDVLEKKISNQSDPDAEATPDKNSTASENPAKNEPGSEQENLLMANIITIQADTLKPVAKTGQNQANTEAATSDSSATPTKNQLAQEIVELPAQASNKVGTNVVALNNTKPDAAADAGDFTTGPKAATAKSVIENHAAASEHTDKPAEKIAANVQKIAENENPQPGDNVVPDGKPDVNADIIKGSKAATAQSVIENRAAASEHTDKPAEQIAANIQKITENTKPQSEPQSLEGKDVATELAKDTATEKLSDLNLKNTDIGQDPSAGNETTAENKSTSGITSQIKNKLSSEEAVAESINQDMSVAQSSNTDQNAAKLTSESVVSITAANNIQPTTTASATQTQSTGTVNAMESAGSVRQNPVEQVIDSINAASVGPDRKINIQLNPAELGRVHIRFQQTNGEITGVIEVEKQETSNEIEKALPQIIAALNESGVQVKRIDVTTPERDQQSSNQQKNETSQAFEEAAYHRFSQNQDNTGSTGDSSSQSVLNDNNDAPVTENQSQTADGRINVFM